METKQTLQIMLDAWRHYDDENDLAAFEISAVAALRAMEVIPPYDHMKILKSVFREVVTEPETEETAE